ncbi:hypothetical protein [Pseudovibrio ascidiaceicola]|uniref:hypothetical protein n=1 Tax=Pseudovibrio ascidiaceicola TaxID=285279 RepID=UPI000D6867F1|nr:hypothetical protein [Pseudovibrio ascidiaceicola]
MAADHAASDKGIGYPLPRQDTHSWIYLTGEQTLDMFAKIFGVDLRAEMFTNKEIAQTVAARLRQSSFVMISADS